LKEIATVKLLFITAVFAVMMLVSDIGPGHAQTQTKNEGNANNSTQADKIDDVGTIIYAWANAWKEKDFDTYMSFYSPEFQSGKFDYNQWMKKKSKVFKRRGIISLEVFYLGIFIKNNHAYVSFIQKYEDVHLADIGEKKMVLVQSQGTWKIVSEEWKRLAGIPR
jgi:murein L,D-transpeptidase YafK